MKTCYIVGAGDFSASFLPEKEDLVVAADGGYKHLCESNIRCDLFVGDSDSLGYIPSDIETITYPVKKDETDMYLAYKAGKDRGYSRFVIYGGTGGRIDHTFANFSLLCAAAKAGDNIEIRDTEWGATVIYNKKIRIHAPQGSPLSVFAFGGKARGVSIEKAAYEASGIELSPDFPLGVSNAFTSEDAEISVCDGALLIIYSAAAKILQ